MRELAVGADSEEHVAEVLSEADVISLHDRKVPKSRANIDHIAVGPAGVYVIDAKRYTGLVEARDKGSLLRSDIRLYVKGRDRTKLVESVMWQCDVVRTALGDDLAEVPIAGVLCFVAANWRGRFSNKAVTVNGVTCIWPTGLADVVEAPGDLSAADVGIVAMRLVEALRPA